MKKLFSRRKGQGLVEYALILVLIAIVVVVILRLLGGQANLVFARILIGLRYPGDYHGEPIDASLGTVTAGPGFDGPTVTASVSLPPGVSASTCVQISVSGGESTLHCGSDHTMTLEGPGSGSVTVCLVGVEGYSLVSSSCSTASY
ncbi:MAG: hypothetical protein ACP5GX_05465 [Anaerolineae bacterium]